MTATNGDTALSGGNDLRGGEVMGTARERYLFVSDVSIVNRNIDQRPPGGNAHEPPREAHRTASEDQGSNLAATITVLRDRYASLDDPVQTVSATIGDVSSGSAIHPFPLDRNAAAATDDHAGEGRIGATSPPPASAVPGWSLKITLAEALPVPPGNSAGGNAASGHAPGSTLTIGAASNDDAGSSDAPVSFALLNNAKALRADRHDPADTDTNPGNAIFSGNDRFGSGAIYSSMSVVTDYTALLSGSYWGGIEVTGTPVIVTFSFPTSFPAYDESVIGFTAATYTSFQAFTATQQAQAIQALGEWAAACGLIFIQVAPGQGDINFMNVDFNTTSYAGAGGVGFYPFGDWNGFSYPNYYGDWSSSGDVFMNSQFLVGGATDYGTLLHETGHAIGLKHPTEIVTNYAADPDVVHDEVLSSDDPTRTIMATVGDGEDLLPLDEQAAAHIYGPAGTGGVHTTSASGSNSVANWDWNATTQTLTQTAVAVGATIQGSSVNDIIYGSSGDDRLFGLSGTDVLHGQAGADSLYGGSGTATLIGGAADDSYYVSSLTTTITENSGEGYDVVYATVSFTLSANVEAIYLYGIGLTGTGNNLDNAIFGDGTYATTLIPGSGNDYVVGGIGNDTFSFAAADLTSGDAVFGGGGSDKLLMISAGAINAGGVSGVETYTLASAGANALTLTNANFTSVTGATIYVTGGSAGNTVNAAALTGSNRVIFTGGAGTDSVSGGIGNDQFKFSRANLSTADTVTGGAGTDTLLMTTAGLIKAGGVSGVEIYTLAGTGANTLTLTNANFANVLGATITINGGNAGNTVNASALTGTNRIVFTGGAGLDNVSGGAGVDQFRFAAANLAGTDIVTGGAGSDTLLMTTAGAINAAGVSGVENITLAGGGANTLTLTNANFANVIGTTINVKGGNAGNTVNASALSNTNRLMFTGAGGVDSATGGAGNDTFTFSAAALSNADTLVGGAGNNDTLSMTTAGVINAGGVSGIENFTLAGTGANTLALADTNFANIFNATIKVNGGSAGNTVDASALTGSNRLIFTGGAGNDTILAGPVTTMTGGAGANQFTFADIGTNSITDFGVSAGNAIVLRDSGFDLGANEGQGTAALQHLDAGAFVANSTGAFSAASQRFAYNTTNGSLLYDRDGSDSAFAAGSVATLTGHPALSAGAAGQLYFTA